MTSCYTCICVWVFSNKSWNLETEFLFWEKTVPLWLIIKIWANYATWNSICSLLQVFFIIVFFLCLLKIVYYCLWGIHEFVVFLCIVHVWFWLLLFKKWPLVTLVYVSECFQINLEILKQNFCSGKKLSLYD
jgi:hypothetical protein